MTFLIDPMNLTDVCGGCKSKLLCPTKGPLLIAPPLPVVID